MARGAGRDMTSRSLELHQANDFRWRIRERRRIWIPLRLRRVIGGDISERGLVQRLGYVRHQLVRSAARSIVVQLLVNRRSRLAGEMRVFRRRRHALLAVAGDTDLLRFGKSTLGPGVGEDLQQ